MSFFPFHPFHIFAMSLALSRFCAVLMLLILAVMSGPAHAQEILPSSEIAPPPEAPVAEQATPAPAKTEAPAKKPAAKKKAKKGSADFKKKHALKKKTKAPAPKDASVSEPTEDIQAIKNRAERQFWEGKQKDSKAGVSTQSPGIPGGSGLERANSSQLAGVTFDDQPLRMPESDAFRKPIDTVAYELGRPCRAREYLGWPLQQTEQARVDRIFGETVEKFRQRGYTVEPHTPKSAGADISVFTADQATGEFDRHILGLWTAGDVGLLLMLCETESETAAKKPAKAASTKAAAKKSKPRKTAAKKPAAPKPAEPKEASIPDPTPSLAATPTPGDRERPVIMPGVAPKEPEPAAAP